MNQDVEEVVEHASSMARDWDFDISRENAGEVVDESSFALAIHLDHGKRAEAAESLLKTHEDLEEA